MNAPSSTACSSAPLGAHAARRRFGALVIGSMGVVFGDIGTSPLYGFQGAVTAAAHGAVGEGEILGITSLIIWALLIVVTIKYVMFIMRADNHGEGGILSLMALAQNALGGRTRIVLMLGVIGAALFYGDAIITPAISVLSAVEGMETVPSLAHAITPSVEIASALVLLIGLFMAQSRGTAKVAAWFGPICLVWFLSIATLGLMQIPIQPRILLAFLPTYGLLFLAQHGVIGMLVLGAVSLTITGAEALYADMGHFGPRPIRAAWLFAVFPALLINYLGQGAFALHFLASPASHGVDLSTQNWFFLMVPEVLRIPMVFLATAATIIASQAVISGAYSMSNSAMQMGLLPRLAVRRTSETEAGQIYMPTVNLMLMLGVILLVGIFKNEAALQDAYGLAVTGTMSVTTALTAVVVRKLWKWSLLRTALVVAPLLTVDLAFYSANMLKLLTGGWVPLVIGATVALVIMTWLRGSAIVSAKSQRDRLPMTDFLASLARRPRHQVPGTAVYLTANPDLTPSALLHNLKHNGVLHKVNAIVAVQTADEPRVPPDHRATVQRLNDSFLVITLAFGFMETPDVPAAMARLQIPGVSFEPADTSYFLGRRTILPTHDHGLRRLQDLLFISLNRNSADPSEVFAIPPGRVVEMGVQVAV
ncbi:MAG: Kup system potassium uptake protein [Caulobacteraceae bacterium]|jgi:KUP system potassium uptake protein|nr:Kup system potassium uptake protein [Caulobacteraceae bacterium]